MFISLEIAFSTSSTTIRRPQINLEPCASTRIGLRDETTSFESIAIAYKCLKVDGDIITFKTGNYSKKSKQVQCSSDDVFLYKTNDKPYKASITEGTIGCLDEPRTPDGRYCATAYAQGRDVFISMTYLERSLEITEYTPNRTFLATKLSFDPDMMLETFAKRAAELSLRQVTDELNSRRYIFVGTTNSTCEFEGNIDEHTNISNAVIAITLSFWIISLSFFAVVMLNKRKVFYDMRSTWDWARKSYHMVDSDRTGDLYVTCVTIDGSRRIYVTDHIEDNRLRIELGTKLVD